MSEYILALDQGTSSSRAILFDHTGTPIANAQRSFRQLYPRPGWVEHDADEIWETQLATARDVLHQAGAGPQQVAALAGHGGRGIPRNRAVGQKPFALRRIVERGDINAVRFGIVPDHVVEKVAAVG